MSLFFKNIKMEYQKHETAIIDKGAQIGSGSKIWHWSHICEGAKIGSKVTIGQNVYIGNKVVIGDKCKIQNNVSIYDNIYLEDNVFCGPSVVFTNVYNPRAFIDRKDKYKDTVIKKGVTLGANSTIICGITIGEFAFVGAGAVVNKDVPPFALMVGVVAKQIGWISRYGEKLDLPLKGNAETICKQTNERYQLKNGQIILK